MWFRFLFMPPTHNNALPTGTASTRIYANEGYNRAWISNTEKPQLFIIVKLTNALVQYITGFRPDRKACWAKSGARTKKTTSTPSHKQTLMPDEVNKFLELNGIQPDYIKSCKLFTNTDCVRWHLSFLKRSKRPFKYWLNLLPSWNCLQVLH